MTESNNNFIALLRSFVTSERAVVSSIDYKELFRLANIHSVQAIIASQIKELSDDLKPSREVMSYFNQQLGVTVQKSAERDIAYNEITEFLNSNNISHIFVKGCVINKYYPVSEFRTFCDIDIIVKADDFEKLPSLFENSSFKISEIVTETITVYYNEIQLEIHKTADVMTSYFDDIFSLCSSDGNLYYLNEYDHLLYVLCHLCKHLAYRGAGIRMLLDIDLMIRGIEDFDCDYFLSLCEKAGIKYSATVIINLSKLWFDTPVDIKEIDITNLLSAFEMVMIDGGNFGYEINSIPLVNADKNKFVTFLRLAFPKKELLRRSYPYYDKNKFLLPVARLNRISDGLFKKRRYAIDSVKQLADDNDTLLIQKSLVDELHLKN